MTWPIPLHGTGVVRVADYICASPGPVTSGDVAARLGLALWTTRHYLVALGKAGLIVKVGGSVSTRWASPANAAVARAEYDAALATRKYPRKKRVTPRGQWRSGQPIRVVSTEWEAGEVLGPNSVFALGGLG